MPPYSEYKEQVLCLFPLVRARAEALKNSEVVKDVQDAQAHLINGKLMVVFCGEFKKGKSSLINALLDAPWPCPVDIDIATRLVTTIAWAEEERITVVLSESGHEKIKPITREEIPDYVMEQRNPQNFRRAERMIILGPFASLKEGFILVDTPGIGGLNTEHTVIAHAAISEADVALFVAEAVEPLTEPELNFIRDELVPRCQHIIFVVTKIDNRADYQTAVNDVRQKLATTLERSPETFTIIPVSSRLKLEYLTSHDADDLAESHFSALEEALWSGLSVQAANILLGSALSDLSQAITDLRLPLEAKRDVYKPPRSGAASEQASKVREALKRLKELQTKNAQWVGMLNTRLGTLTAKLRQQVDVAFVELNGQMINDVFDPKLVKHPQKILDRLTSQIILLCGNLHDAAKTQATDIEDELRRMTKLDLPTVNSKPLPATPYTPTLPKPRRRFSFKKVWEWLLTGFETVVAVAIPLLWARVPRAITNLAYATKRLFEKEQLPPAQTQTNLGQFLNKSKLEVRQGVDDTVEDLRQSLSKELKDQIQRDVMRCEEILKGFDVASTVPPDKIGPSLTTVEWELKQLDTLQQRINRLADAIAAGEAIAPEEETGGFADE